LRKRAQLNGRVIARILHGLSSPAFASSEWQSSPHWARHVTTPFAVVAATAQSVLDEMRRDVVHTAKC
jgi:ATP-dependent DNA helicase Q4